MRLEFLELPDNILRSQTFPVRLAGATRAYLLCMPCVTFEDVCVYVHDPDHADEWGERCLCDYTFDPKTGLGHKTPLFDGDEGAYAWSLRLLASDASARRRLMRLCDDMKSRRYTLEAAPAGNGSWLVLAADGGKIGELHLTAAYERDDLGRAHHALYLTLCLPMPPRRNWHPCATCRIWERDPHVAEPLEAQMPQPWPDPDRGEDGVDHLERARVILADLWLSGEVKGLWRRVME